jgi:hypothetical protein
MGYFFSHGADVAGAVAVMPAKAGIQYAQNMD